MLDPKEETKVPWYAGAFTGVVFLTAAYLHHVDRVDLSGGGFFLICFRLLVAAPFIAVVAWPSFAGYFSLFRADERDRQAWIDESFRRFLRFTGGFLLVSFPGVLVVFILLGI